MSYDKLFKLVLIGDNGVGKQTLRRRFGFAIDESESEEVSKLHTGVQVYGKDVELNDVGICRIHILEIEGREKFRSIVPSCVEGANGVIFLFDITKVSTLTLLDDWLDTIREKNPDIPVVLVGNKADLQEKRAIGRLDSFEFAHDRFCKAYIEISAQTGKKVEIAFHMITQIMWDYEKHKK